MAAANTYTPIASYTAGANFTSYTFSSIPSTYTDIVIVINTGRINTTVNPSIIYRFNGDTATNYSMVKVRGDGTNSYSNRETNVTSINGNYFSMGTSVTNIFIANVMNYSNTSIYKGVICENIASGSNSSGADITMGLWRSTSAINSITVNNDGGGNYLLAGTTITLFGIAEA